MAFKDTWTVSSWGYSLSDILEQATGSTTHLFTILGAGKDSAGGDQTYKQVRLKKTDVSTATIVWQFSAGIVAGNKGTSVNSPIEMWYTSPIPRTRGMGRMTVLRHGQGR